MSDTPYVNGERRGIPSPEELRARIPGWGADLDPADRPSVPRELADAVPAHAHWHFPEEQPDPAGRERSIEHARLTPVFGTSAPLRGVPGAIRRLAYDRYSEARAAHWLLLLAADRVEVTQETLRSFVSGRPDNPLTETGIAAELSGHGLFSRLGRDRVDVRHHPVDAVIVGAPWVLGGWAVAKAARPVARRLLRGRPD
ncbi:hypothetical protein KG112_03190 [Nocardioides sp. zg-ZUI104]|uniref:hypothetical protein n=1 Tax=Nocardioides faecalis TaxID=2803858 RepID=UPI001BD02F4E|nr:hypothetical protein [Nocardioides faecalis]MBS4751814.1 hypothetical protein [Nocardioides faecalis]